ncbi:MAG: Uma2 family endonuclease, partial [Desulfovermiculus sp.]
ETDLYLSQDTVVRPDIMVICHEPGPRLIKAPDIIFEVISRQSSRRDEIFKYHLYAEEGVRFYGLVYPELKKVKLFQLQEDKYIKIGDFSHESYLFSGLECNICLDFSKIWMETG